MCLKFVFGIFWSLRFLIKRNNVGTQNFASLHYILKQKTINQSCHSTVFVILSSLAETESYNS